MRAIAAFSKSTKVNFYAHLGNKQNSVHKSPVLTLWTSTK